MKQKSQESVSEIKESSMLRRADLLRKYSVIRAILLSCDKKELSGELKSKVMSTRFALKKYLKDFEDISKDGHEDLKPEGFDERMKPAVEFQEMMKAKYPKASSVTEEMLEKLSAEEKALKEKFDAFNPEYQKWNEECTKFDSDKLTEKVDYKLLKFTDEEYDEILNVNTSENYSIQIDLTMSGITRMAPATLPGADFMEMVHEEFVD